MLREIFRRRRRGAPPPSSAALTPRRVCSKNPSGLIRATDIIGRVSPHRAPIEAMQQIAEMDSRQIFSVLRHEQLQTVVLVTSVI